MFNHGVPIGEDYLLLLKLNGEQVAQLSNDAKGYEDDLRLIGTSLCALYQAATCHRKCWNQGHVLESLCGRAHNLGSAAYRLILLGYYDEAFNLVRAIGETYNIVLLSVFDNRSLQRWLKASRKERLQNFSPVKVRLLLEASAKDLPMIVDEEWYSNLCEKYVHISAETLPNMHNDQRPVAAGIFQEQGLKESLGTLGEILAALAMLICRYFQFDDINKLLVGHIEKAGNNEKKGRGQMECHAGDDLDPESHA